MRLATAKHFQRAGSRAQELAAVSGYHACRACNVLRAGLAVVEQAGGAGGN